MMAALCLWALRLGDRPRAFLFSSLVLATTLNLLYSPHYPWYFLWLLPYLAIVPWRPALYLATAATYLFATNLGAPGEPMYHLNLLLYGGFAAMLALDSSGSASAKASLRVGFSSMGATPSFDSTFKARNL
jgi:hypothetical protein